MSGTAAAEPDISRLPKAYRDHIRGLRSRVAELESMLERPESRVLMRPDLGPPAYLPDDLKYRFVLGDRDHVDVRIQQQEAPYQLELYGSEPLVVVPSVSNVVFVATRRGWLQGNR